MFDTSEVNISKCLYFLMEDKLIPNTNILLVRTGLSSNLVII